MSREPEHTPRGKYPTKLTAWPLATFGRPPFQWTEQPDLGKDDAVNSVGYFSCFWGLLGKQEKQKEYKCMYPTELISSSGSDF